MDVLFDDGCRNILSHTIASPVDWTDPFAGEPYVCMVWNHGSAFDSVKRKAVAVKLIDSNCRYAVCGGVNCENWHDDIDTVFVKGHQGLSDAKYDAVMLMTTWHDDESLEDIAFFFVQSTRLNGKEEFENYLVLHVGEGEFLTAVNEAVRKEAAGEAGD